MLRVTIEIFSGRENPSWVIEDQAVVDDVLRRAASNPAALAEVGSGFVGLGFRGIRVEVLADYVPHGLPSSFEVAGGSTVALGGTPLDPEGSASIAERLLETLPEETAALEGGDVKAFKVHVGEEIARFQSARPVVNEGAEFAELLGVEPEAKREVEVDLDEILKAVRAATCPWIATPFNPGFWNDPSHIYRNNCYNFACNQRTDTFAQPGRAHGYSLSSVNCPDVDTGALRDGNHRWGDCFPRTDWGLWITAMVTGTIGGFRDYHWYRLHTGGKWCHKPGGTPAVDYDSCNRPIYDPRTACRGGYIYFCGFYQTDYTRVRIR